MKVPTKLYFEKMVKKYTLIIIMKKRKEQVNEKKPELHRNHTARIKELVNYLQENLEGIGLTRRINIQ